MAQSVIQHAFQGCLPSELCSLTSSNRTFPPFQAYISQIGPIYGREIHGFFESARLGVIRKAPQMVDGRGGRRSIFDLVHDCSEMLLAGSMLAINATRKDKQYMQNQSSGGQADYDPFSLKNSSREFRGRCDKVSLRCWNLF